MSTVQERHLAIRLDPHFVPRVLREDRERSDVESEFQRFGEFA
jgi:hypothetical protein